MLTNLLSIDDLSLEDLMTLLHRAEELKQGSKSILTKKYTVANLFFENSTRTSISFQLAEKKLGLDVINFNPQTSSIQKGESLYDTVLTLAALEVDAVVIRHTQNEYYKELLQNSITCNIINAGDGSGQHPTQCLLDLMTIYEEFGTLQGLKVAIVGDLSHSRVARSNMMILKKFGSQVYFAGPKTWYSSEFDQFGEYKALDELVPEVDVMMMLRVQHERHDANESFTKEAYHAQYGLTKTRYQQLKETAIVMHPGPINRDVELDSELVEAPQSRFVKQMHNGLYIRTALLETILHNRA